MIVARLLSDLEELLGLVGDAVDAPLRHVELELAQVGLHLQPHLLLERDKVAQRVAELERRHRRRRRPTRHLRRRGRRRRRCIKVGSLKHSSKYPWYMEGKRLGNRRLLFPSQHCKI